MADPFAPDHLTTVINEARQRARERAREAARDAARREIGALASPARRAAASPPSRAAALPIPEPAKEGLVAFRLPNGRRVNAVLSPDVARRSDLAAIARASADNNRRAFDALQAQSAAVDGLKRSQEQLVGKVAQLEKRADDAFLALTQTFSQSSRQLKELAAQGQKALTRAGTAATTAVQTLAITQQAQNLTNVIGTAQATAYGERGSVLAPNNLLLAGNQLLWTFLAPVSVALGASAGTAMVLALLAPLGTLVTGFAAVGSRLPERRQQRFITGIELFDGKTVNVRVPLRDRFTDDDLFKEFRDRTDVPVTVSIIDSVATQRTFLFAKVVRGELEIAFLGSPNLNTRIAWMVDTGAEDG